MKLIIKTDSNKDQQIEDGCIALNREGFTVHVGSRTFSNLQHTPVRTTTINLIQQSGAQSVEAIYEDADNPAETQQLESLIVEHFAMPLLGSTAKVDIPEPDTELERSEEDYGNFPLFEFYFNQVADAAHKNANDKGFWDARNELSTIISDRASHLSPMVKQLINSQCLDLIHSELGEATEALRGGGIDGIKDDKIPDFLGVEAELADVIIRIMDVSRRNNWRVGEAIVAKMKMNSTRPRLHGKSY